MWDLYTIKSAGKKQFYMIKNKIPEKEEIPLTEIVTLCYN